MLDYIIKVLLFQTLFLAVYDILLKKETFFQWNRLYLIFTSIVAYAVPLIKIESVQKIIPQEYVVFLPEIILTPTTIIKQQFDWSQLFFSVLQTIFWIGVVLASLLFFVKLYKIIRLIYKNEKEFSSNYYLVWLNKNTAFSFFNYIFLGKENTNKTQIIEHELVHVQQRHSLDLLFFELQKIVCWFNPFSYLYQQRISELHEFIADSKAVKEDDKALYFENLLAETFGVQYISFINPFLKHSLIKKRIMMLNKSKSKQFQKLKYLLLIPVLTSMLIYTSCERSDLNEIDSINRNEKRKTTLFYGSGEKQVEIKSKKREGYFDLYMLGAKPEGEEISYNNLSVQEKIDYDELVEKSSAVSEAFGKYKIFEDKDGKKALFQELDWKEIKKGFSSKKNYSEEEAIPFSAIEQSPVFPGCEDTSDSKECFQKSIQQHVGKNFNTNLAKNLGLEPKDRKVYVIFKIDKNGMITEVRARGPHKDLEKEAIRVIKSLPQMQAGEHSGNKVAVKYTLPITFKID